MSSGNALVDAIEAVQAEIKRLGATIKAADPAKVAEQAERGASRAVAPLADITRDLKSIVSDLRVIALPAAQRAQEAEERRRRWKWGVVALVAVLGLLGAFGGGMYVATDNLKHPTTAAICGLLGGSWSLTSDGRHGCWISP